MTVHQPTANIAGCSTYFAPMTTYQFDARQAQTRLASEGRYKGAIDGLFGPLSWLALLLAVARRGERTNDSVFAADLARQALGHNLTTRYRIAHFLGQTATESGGFVRLVENLSYSASRLMVVWPRRFPSLASTAGYANNPEMLANKVYGGRMGNRPLESGDGWRYRGRSLIQVTGHDNYAAAEAGTGLPLTAHPELASQPDNAVALALDYWSRNNLNRIADRDDLAGLRKAIQGGSQGLDEARIYTSRAMAILK